MFIIILLLAILIFLHYVGYRMINDIQPYIPPFATDAMSQIMQYFSRSMVE